MKMTKDIIQMFFLVILEKNHIKLDYNCEIFQCLIGQEEELSINNSKSRLYNKVTGTEPCQILTVMVH